jgi:hypothetical protein
MLVGEEKKGTASGLFNFLNQALSWLGVLTAQILYHINLSSSVIFQYMAIIILCGSLVAIFIFLKAYPTFKNQLEI